jgi:hypothetical protein
VPEYDEVPAQVARRCATFSRADGRQFKWLAKWLSIRLSIRQEHWAHGACPNIVRSDIRDIYPGVLKGFKQPASNRLNS